jgi:hypothetical protein
MAGTLGVTGVVTANAGIQVDALNIDGRTIASTDANGHINISPNGTGNVNINTDTVAIVGAEGEFATLMLQADEADDNADAWGIRHNTDNTLTFINQISGSLVPQITLTPHATVASSTTYIAGKVGIGTAPTLAGFRISQPTSGEWAMNVIHANSGGVNYGLSVDTSAGAANDVGCLQLYPPTGGGFMVTNRSKVGIGTPSPARTLTIDNDSLACVQLCNATTGAAAGDGFQMQLASSTGYLYNYEAGPIIFGTSGAAKLTIPASGALTTTVGLTLGGALTTTSGNQDFKGYASWTTGTGTSGIFMHYNSSNSYRGYHDWRTLQLGNNGSNHIIAGNTSGGGQLKFWVNATGISQSGDTTNSGINAMTIAADGVVSTVGDFKPGADIILNNGRGINFTDTANSSGSMTSETLDDYEEGTWTPTDASGGGLTFTSPVGTYVKVGQLVTASFALTFPASGGSYLNVFGGLPFTSMTTSNTMWGGFITYTDFGEDVSFIVGSNATTFTAYTSAPVQPNIGAMFGKSFRATIVYRASA